MTPPPNQELVAFLGRYMAAMEDGGALVDEAVTNEAGPSSLTFGFDIRRLHQAAFRNALPPGSHVHLPVIVRYRIPDHVETLISEFPSPDQRMATARQKLMAVAVAVGQAKTATWEVHKKKADYDALYDALNRVLATVAEAMRPIEALQRLEERGVFAHEGTGDDAIVACPMAGVPVTVRFSCARCVWKGPDAWTCYAPEARRFMEGLRVAGMGAPAGIEAGPARIGDGR